MLDEVRTELIVPGTMSLDHVTSGRALAFSESEYP